MSRYRLGKLQVKRLLEGKPVMDGHGRKYYADEKVKETLQVFDKANLYNKADLIMEDGKLDIVEKAECEGIYN